MAIENVKEIEDYFNSEEGKAALEPILESYAKSKGYKTKDEIDGLIKNNRSLIEEKKKLKEKIESGLLTEAQKARLEVIDEMGIDDPEVLRKELDKLKGLDNNANKGLEYEREMRKYQKMLEAAEAEKKALNEKYSSEKNLRIASVKQSQLTEALKKANVKAEAFDMAYAFFERQAAHEEKEDGSISFYIKDNDGMNPDFNTYVTEWAKSEKAKSFIDIPKSAGGGANNPNGVKMTYTRAELADPAVAKDVLARKTAGQNIEIIG